MSAKKTKKEREMNPEYIVQTVPRETSVTRSGTTTGQDSSEKHWPPLQLVPCQHPPHPHPQCFWTKQRRR